MMDLIPRLAVSQRPRNLPLCIPAHAILTATRTGWQTHLVMIEIGLLQSTLRHAVLYEKLADADCSPPLDLSPLNIGFLKVYHAVKAYACEGPPHHIINLLVDEGVSKQSGKDQATDIDREYVQSAMLG